MRRVLSLLAVMLPAVAAPLVGDESRAERYLYPAKDIDPAALKTDDRVVVTEDAKSWAFKPSKGAGAAGLLFFPGGGVDPVAYAPLARTVATEGFPVYLVRLPGKVAAPNKHRKDSIAIGKGVIKSAPGVERWAVAGHSMGGAIAAQFVHEEPKRFRGLILLGTTHPRDFDLSAFGGDVTKVYGTEDRVAKHAQSEANKKLLPAGTTWVEVKGGNHAQFGYYGTQIGDGKAVISRESQQQAAREALVKAMRRASKLPK
jgi:pimeloyl-ACP methyl ester carboxylesterase